MAILFAMAGLFDGTALEQPVTCETCRQADAECACPRDVAGRVCRPRDQPARVQREKRRGKWTTVVSGLDPAATDLPAMLKRVKKQCSAGGTATADGFEVQGDHRDKLVEMLRSLGYPAKASGG
ncbi:MAG: translation initiation factor [Planctomycetota bacterium]